MGLSISSSGPRVRLGPQELLLTGLFHRNEAIFGPGLLGALEIVLLTTSQKLDLVLRSRAQARYSSIATQIQAPENFKWPSN